MITGLQQLTVKKYIHAAEISGSADIQLEFPRHSPYESVSNMPPIHTNHTANRPY